MLKKLTRMSHELGKKQTKVINYNSYISIAVTSKVKLTHEDVCIDITWLVRILFSKQTQALKSLHTTICQSILLLQQGVVGDPVTPGVQHMILKLNESNMYNYLQHSCTCTCTCHIDMYMNISEYRVILGHREPRMETSHDMSAKYIIWIPKESETHNNTCMLRLCWFIGSTEIRIMAALRLDVHTQYCDSSVDIPEHSLAQVLTILLQRCCQLYCRHLFLQKQKFKNIWKKFITSFYGDRWIHKLTHVQHLSTSTRSSKSPRH